MRVPDRPPPRDRDRARALAAAAPIGAILALAALSGCGADSESTQGSTGGAGTLSKQSGSAPTATQAGGEQASGGGGAASSLTPTEQVDLAIKSVLASGVPDLACRQYSTERYVKTTFGGRAGCVKSTLPASAAQSIEERKIEIKGEEASATIVPSGGPSDGETIKVTLVRRGAVWKVDTLHSNAPVGP